MTGAGAIANQNGGYLRVRRGAGAIVHCALLPGQYGRRLGGGSSWPRTPGMALRSLIVVAGVWQYWALLVDWRGGGAVR